MILDAEMAELADALGSGPSPGHTGWRFESSFRQFVNVKSALPMNVACTKFDLCNFHVVNF